jgi:hypothetical protein
MLCHVHHIFCVLLLSLCSVPAYALYEEEPAYTETSVFLLVQGIGGVEIPAVVSKEASWLSVTDVFDFLKIRSSLSGGADTVSGSFITEQALFIIDRKHHRILFQGKVFELQPNDFIRTPTSLFMKTELFGLVFGLDCKFNFRSLSVKMDTKLELPAIREKKQEIMHNNINRLRGQLVGDTLIKRTYPLFQFGMADWAVITTQRMQGNNDTRLNLSLGAIIAGGETNVSLNYNNTSRQQLSQTHDSMNVIRPFDQRQQYYRWRLVNNDHRALRQIIAGKIFAQSTASIYDPVVGVQVTNTPTTFRRSFGSYTLSNFTEPGWGVELYVNNELVDYLKADASGFFTFQVPLVYGNSLVKLRFYGPWGEERIREENISIPFNFLPQREFEYMLSAGVVEDSINSRFGRLSLNYGATKYITVGGGVEYLSSVKSGKIMPYVNTSVRIASNLLFSGDYSYGIRARGILSYRLPSNLQIELNYSRYKKGQTAINYNYLEERKVTVSKPFFGRSFAVFTRLTMNQIILPETKYTTAEWLMSGAVKSVGANLTTFAIITDQQDPYLYSNLSLTFRMPAQILVTPQIQYEYNHSKIISSRCEVGKYLFRRGYMNISYEKNFKSNFSNAGVGFRYDFSFARTSVSAMRSNNETVLVQSAAGSLINDHGHLDVNNRSSVGLGGIVMAPFLDLNDNGHRDAGEPRVEGLQIVVNGGRIIHDKRDTTIRILDLEPYTNYYIDMSRNSFNNIAWQVKYKTMSVAIDANRVKRVEVPVIIAGEASGTVSLKKKDQLEGIGRIVICIYRQNGSLAGRVVTEPDGFFSFMGLAPGNYIASADTIQLHKLGIKATPANIPFHISKTMEGDIADGLEFKLEYLKEEEH